MYEMRFLACTGALAPMLFLADLGVEAVEWVNKYIFINL